MKRILIGSLLVILATFYIVQRQQIIDYITSLSSESQQVVVEEVEKPKAKKVKQEVELLGYPAPPTDEPLFGYPPPDNSPTHTPFPTPTQRPTPTYAPTMNPWDD